MMMKLIIIAVLFAFPGLKRGRHAARQEAVTIQTLLSCNWQTTASSNELSTP
jgi:hypothetical protein